MELVFCRQIFEKCSKTNFIKICPMGVKLLHSDGQTDRQKNVTKLIVALRNFANAHKKYYYL